MATDPIDMANDFDSIVLRPRRQLAASGKDKAPVIGRYDSPLGPEERAAILKLLRDGTYQEAARRVGDEDPELAVQ